MPKIEEHYDVVVVGAGHAGCEAALACARMGFDTIIFTVSIESIAMMPCNPNIGGSSKGHIVREVDALGGEMGINIDHTFLQSKMLNRSKGPAVHSLRAQADKAAYSARMREILQTQEHLSVRQAEVAGLLWEDDAESSVDGYVDSEIVEAGGNGNAVIAEAGEEAAGDHVIAEAGEEAAGDHVSTEAGEEAAGDHVSTEAGGKTECDRIQEKVRRSTKKILGVTTVSGAKYFSKAVILCTGTYLNARCLCGEVIDYTGPNGLQAATHLTDSLKECGVTMQRFKTGTPARMDGRTIDFSKMQEQFGDTPIVPFSFMTDPKDVQIDQVSCWLTYTNEETHRVIRENLDRSPMYSGVIEGTGPRYCPSIEDKVVRFADKNRHQVFLEPEGLHTTEMYVDGMSSSLPEDVQAAMYRTVPGLENAKIVRNAYAIEYDCIDPRQLKSSLEFKNIEGLFAAGQFNGSSGYEEAAGQGIVAGINAALKIRGKEPMILDRSESYIGVLIDDLVTKENTEPYRMMTSRAEYRLLLRQDNADLRLTPRGYEAGLIPEDRYQHIIEKEKQIEEEVRRIRTVHLGGSEPVQTLLENLGSQPLNTGTGLEELIRRPELDYDKLAPLDPDRPALSDEVCEQVNIRIKYEGYIERQMKQVRQFKRLEKKLIPEDLDYMQISGLRNEAKQKLAHYRPASIGQASRISGVSPADISVLLVYLEQRRR